MHAGGSLYSSDPNGGMVRMRRTIGEDIPKRQMPVADEGRPPPALTLEKMQHATQAIGGISASSPRIVMK